MDENGSWGTEVEILAASAILDVNIYVASECNTIHDNSRLGFTDRDIKWYRYSAAPNYDEKFAINIANFQSHYKPVVNCINSDHHTYSNTDKEVICLD